MSELQPYAPELGRFPDGRKAKAPLFDPIFCAYLAPLLGSSVAALPALYNAIFLRRVPLGLLALLLGWLSRPGFALVLDMLWDSGLEHIPLVLLAGRIFHLVLGVVLAWSQAKHVRGHQALGGRMVPLFAGILIALVATQILPWKTVLSLLGLELR